MKLTDIDLTDKTEIQAAIALLQAIAGDAVPLSAPAGEIAQDAAAVFGATPLPGAPSAAAAAPLPTAPAGLPGISTPLPGLPAPAAHIAAAALVPGGAAAAALIPPASGVELDSTGLPWDERIHASTKTKTQKGVWTARRGVNDEAFIKSVEAELRATVQSAAPLAQTLPGIAAAAANTPSEAMALPGASALPAAASADPQTFEQLMPRVTQASIAGLIPPTALQQVCGLLGLQSVVALQTSPEYVPHVWAQLKANYPALQ